MNIYDEYVKIFAEHFNKNHSLRPLFRTTVSPDFMWKIFKCQLTEKPTSGIRTIIKKFGNVVYFDDQHKITSVFDFTLPSNHPLYIANNLISSYIKSARIHCPFLTEYSNIQGAQISLARMDSPSGIAKKVRLSMRLYDMCKQVYEQQHLIKHNKVDVLSFMNSCNAYFSSEARTQFIWTKIDAMSNYNLTVYIKAFKEALNNINFPWTNDEIILHFDTLIKAATSIDKNIADSLSTLKNELMSKNNCISEDDMLEVNAYDTSDIIQNESNEISYIKTSIQPRKTTLVQCYNCGRYFEVNKNFHKAYCPDCRTEIRWK